MDPITFFFGTALSVVVFCVLAARLDYGEYVDANDASGLGDQ